MVKKIKKHMYNKEGKMEAIKKIQVEHIEKGKM